MCFARRINSLCGIAMRMACGSSALCNGKGSLNTMSGVWRRMKVLEASIDIFFSVVFGMANPIVAQTRRAEVKSSTQPLPAKLPQVLAMPTKCDTNQKFFNCCRSRCWWFTAFRAQRRTRARRSIQFPTSMMQKTNTNSHNDTV